MKIRENARRKGSTITSASHAEEVSAGKRFEFGRNWARFLDLLNEERILSAEYSLRQFLKLDSFEGLRFLDAGSGSGLFSLAARRLGASVHSFDYDPHSVACTRELRRRFFPDDPDWRVEEASVLDRCYLSGLGQFDIVYSWGVLHHTGAMWEALENVAPLVADGGQIFLAIYNDQGTASKRWLMVKKRYNQLPGSLRPVLAGAVAIQLWWRRWVKDLIRLQPFETWRAVSKERGMSAWRDVVDWVGGYPFEVAVPERIFDFYSARGFTLVGLQTCAGTLGCNQFVFRKGS